MEARRAFPALRRFKIGLAELYARYSELFADDREARTLFFRLSLEEKSHVALLDFERNLARQNPSLFGEVDVDVEGVTRLSASVEDLLEQTATGLEGALSSALEIETSASEYHMNAAVRQACPSCSRLLDRLGRADRNHVDKLVEFARSRNVRVGVAAASPWMSAAEARGWAMP